MTDQQLILIYNQLLRYNSIALVNADDVNAGSKRLGRDFEIILW
jgi:hypothetical protein